MSAWVRTIVASIRKKDKNIIVFLSMIRYSNKNLIIHNKLIIFFSLIKMQQPDQNIAMTCCITWKLQKFTSKVTTIMCMRWPMIYLSNLVETIWNNENYLFCCYLDYWQSI